MSEHFISKVSDALRRAALATAIGAGLSSLAAVAALACDCNGDNYGYGPYQRPSYANAPCFGRDCGAGRYDRHYHADPYQDSYYAQARLDPYHYYNPDYDGAYYDDGDCDGDGCY